SPLFSEYSEVFHGTTTKQYGPVKRDISSVQKLCDAYKRKTTDLITAEQTHGNIVSEVSSQNGGVVAPSADGLILRSENTDETKNLFLGIFTADCVPVFFYDPTNSLVGLCHGGWRGVYGKIVTQMVDMCRKNGSDPINLRVSLGPHIRACSYSVPEERAEQFEKMYGKNTGVVSVFDTKYFLNLSEAIFLDLIQSGVKSDNIDHDSSPCTYCDTNAFYSYRRRSTEEYSEMISFIGFR
ncbi:MAG: peptidoglycan editing factor PgeF, partial [Patescibacteria group bacterium]